MATLNNKYSAKNVSKPGSAGLGSIFKNKKALTIIGSLVALILFGVVAGVAYYYVTYGELPSLTASSAGNKGKCNERQNKVCSKNKKGEEVCKCEKGSDSGSGGRQVNGTQLCGCTHYDGSGKCTEGARYWQTEAVKQCPCYYDSGNYYGLCIKPPKGVYQDTFSCNEIQNIVCKAND